MAVAIYDADPLLRESEALNESIASATAETRGSTLLQAVVVDGNLGGATFKVAAELARAAGAVCVLEPVSEPKAGGALAAALLLSGDVDIATPNRGELRAMAAGVRAAGWEGPVQGGEEEGEVALPDDADNELRDLCQTVLFAMASAGPAAGASRGKHLLVTEGAKGVMLASLEHVEGQDRLIFERFHAPPVASVVSATGAGDTFLAGTVCGLVARRPAAANAASLRESLRDAIPYGLAAARETLGSEEAVANTLTWADLEVKARALRVT